MYAKGVKNVLYVIKQSVCTRPGCFGLPDVEGHCDEQQHTLIFESATRIASTLDYKRELVIESRYA